MYKVVKRDGAVAEFDIAKISAAISKAFDALNKQTHPTVIDLLALKVTSDFESKIKDGLIAVEDIQDSVESVLSQAGYADVAKAYILYRKQREKVRNMKSTATSRYPTGALRRTRPSHILSVDLFSATPAQLRLTTGCPRSTMKR